LVIGVAAVSLVVWRAAEVGCRQDGPGRTAEAAVERFYERCRTDIALTDFGAAEPPSVELTDWHAWREFSVDYDGKTVFVVAGQRTPGDDWEVVGGENSGP
jgi:hypothetical protein